MGRSEFSLRLTALLFGSLSILAIYFLVSKLHNNFTALVASLLLAINPFAIYCSQNLRFDTFFHFLSLFSSYYFIIVFRDKEYKKQWHYIFYTVCALHSHPYSSFFYLGQITTFAVLKYFNYINTTWKYFINKNIIIATLCSPIFLWTVYLTLSSYVSVGNVGFEPIYLSNLLLTPLQYFFNVDYGLFVVLLSLLLFNIILLKKSYDKQSLIWISCTLFGTLLMPFIISKVFITIYYYRFTSAGLSAIILFMALSISNSYNILTHFLSMLILILNLSPLVNYYSMPNNDLWREASEYLSINVKEDDLIVVQPPYLDEVLKHNMSEKFKNKFINPINLDYFKKQIAPSKRIWVLESYDTFDKGLKNVLDKFGEESSVTIVTSDLIKNKKIVSGHPIRITSVEKRP